jgi:replicative DNA helicase
MTAPNTAPAMSADDRSGPPSNNVPRETPIWNEDAERAVLSALLLVGDEDEFRTITALTTRITPAMFYRGAHRVTYEAMLALYARKVTIDPLTLSNELEARGNLGTAGGKEFIGGLLDEVPTAANIAHWDALLVDCWKRRELTSLARKIAAMAKDRTLAIDDVFSWAGKSLAPMASGHGEKGFRKIRQGLLDAWQRIINRGEGTLSDTIPTGLPELDAKLDGGFERGQLIVVCAVPGGGKTSFVWNLLRDLTLDGRGATAFVSCEMTEGMLLESALSAESEVARSHLKSGKVTDEEGKQLAEAMKRLLDAPIYVDDTAMPDIEDVCNRCRMLKAQEPGLVAIGVDFIQLLQVRDRERGELQAEMLRKIAYRLKTLALELNVAVFALAQPNDKDIEKREDKRPQINDMQGSSGMRQAADQIWLLYRPLMYGTKVDTIEINVAKNKLFDVGTAYLKWDGPRVRVVSPQLEKLKAEAKALAAKPLELGAGGTPA